ncbi:HAD family hydrolase [Planctomicrobium piriforme]|uniref:Phosphoserine phosphatase n=1 Tax=Planctomicrobium piriforme TaxID=1576369 RepID=A0A1I3SYB2_9PLAN|nr:HAD family hydrolase [Planctomicrobium piriforme]SFJ63420.1 Phosphoserine phosphatase [Planctomicrobium piriforme]
MTSVLLRQCLLISLLQVGLVSIAAAEDPLPSWNDGPAKQAILQFVAKVTTPGSPDFVPVPDRIATFDNDGTLWCEQPSYVQWVFAVDRLKELAPQHPEWKDTLLPLLSGEMSGKVKFSEHEIAVVVGSTHSGMTPDEFETIVSGWLKTAKHPRFDRLYTELVYQPMLELLAYLRGQGFKTFIVSGGGIDFIRGIPEEIYGVPPYQVVGSSGRVKFEFRDDIPVLIKGAAVQSIDDGPGKPENIELHIGQRPVMAFGNSDGDLQMLQWTTAGKGPRFGLLVHHTDAEREYAYDRDSRVGKLNVALDQAPSHGWTVVSMKTDWKQIFPLEK